ncbi:uncharacterized protein LOC108225137 [Daucus carota subsp. sativus]|uniref:uncharacterized protein LOC108225137 n=1 Tax=Daucus carota subsp. sativus TaxID=79200 RepID=UPI0030833CE9
MSWYLIINEDVNIQPLNQNLNPLHEATLNSFALESQVFEVSTVTSDSLSLDVQVEKFDQFKRRTTCFYNQGTARTKKRKMEVFTSLMTILKKCVRKLESYKGKYLMVYG